MTISVKLPLELEQYVKAQVSSGRYTSAAEVLAASLRLLESHEEQEAEKLAWLRAAWREGIESGDAGEIDPAAFKAEARRRLAEGSKTA